MKKKLFQYLALINLFAGTMFGPQAMAAEFHVTNATEFQNALNTAAANGEDDTIYLAAGTYQGNFTYTPPNTEHKFLTIMGEPGTHAEDIILDGQNSGRVLDIYDWTDGNVAEIRIDGITVQNGNSPRNAGGIYAALAPYNISITNCIVRNNRAKRSGGGILANSHENITLENNLIFENAITEDDDGISRGGGVAMLFPGGNYLVRNNIIVHNAAQGATDPQGGGIWVGWSGGDIIHFFDNTIYDNQAKRGGGVYFNAGNTANVYNNIIYGNTALEGGDIYFSSLTTKNGYNNNYSNIYGTWTNSGNNLNTDPLFVDPVNNDFHLQGTSPMIDAGTTTVPNPPGLPATDFEGNPRIIGPAPDIGAYESSVSSPVNPGEGTIGTVIIISGSDFDFGTKKGKVSIGNSALTILEWTNTSIECKLTKALPPGPYDVTIRPQARGSSPIVMQNGFTVKAPEIDSIDPTIGSSKDKITINGFFFGNKKGKVTLEGKGCKVLSWTMVPTTGESEIEFVVPKGLSAGTNELKVTTTGVGWDTVNFNVE